MLIELTIDCEIFLSILKDGDPEELYDMLEKLDRFPYLNIFTYDDALNEIYEVLYDKRHVEKYRPISHWLDRTHNNGRDVIVFNNELFHEKNSQLIELVEDESNNIKGILLNNENFHSESGIAGLGDGIEIRYMNSIEKMKKLLILLSQNEDTVQSFFDILKQTFDEIIFDEDIEESVKTLEAGFDDRKTEILYHLYCIDKEIPILVKQYLGNQEIGSHMSVPCSPERNRKLVEDKLTKKVGGKEIKCELHTKMKKIGSRKPDRIYFSPKVNEHILNNDGRDMIDKIYIYKIGEHV